MAIGDSESATANLDIDIEFDIGDKGPKHKTQSKYSSIELQSNIDAKRRNSMPDEESTEGSHDKGVPYIENVDVALNELGKFGSHQVKIFLIQCTCMCMGSYAFYPMGFYEL